MRRLAWFVVVALATVTVVIALWEFRGAIVLFLLSLVLAATVRPLTNALVQRGLSPGWALLLIYAVGLGFLGILVYSLGTRLLTELQQVANSLATTYEQITILWQDGSPFQKMVAERLPPAPELYNALAGEQGVLLVETILGLTVGALGVASEALVALVLSIYWGGSHTRFERLWLSLLPAEQRVRARDVWRAVEKDVGAYVRSELIQSLAAGCLLGLGYWGLGMPYPLLLALLGALARLVPLLGTLIVVIPIALVALPAAGPALAISATLYTAVILFILEVIVEPYFFNRRRFSSLLLVLLMLIMATDFGLLGLVLAAPLAIAVQASFKNLMRQAMPTTSARQTYELTDLQEQLAGVRTMMETMDEPSAPETVSLVERLDDLIKQAADLLPTKPQPETPVFYPSPVSEERTGPDDRSPKIKTSG